ncbi:hypothetical protein ACWEKT_12015 [Nocardia takedensis]
MNRPEWTPPTTRAEALLMAHAVAGDPETLVPYPHPGLENAEHGKGFAFRQTIATSDGDIDGYVLISTEGYGSGLLSGSGRTLDAVIAAHLAEAAHANRTIPDSALSPALRVAADAYDAGLTSVAEAPGRAALDDAAADYADYALLTLRGQGDRTVPARSLFARHDHLQEGPTAGRRYTRPCPRCGSPAHYEPRYPRAVCADCRTRTTDRAGRPVTGFNTHMSGGFIAYYADTVDPATEECVEVTRTGACLIGGRPATMEEAYFGGIAIQMAPED